MQPLILFYGFAPPYNFNRAAPFIFSALLLIATIVAAVTLAGFGLLGWGTIRAGFLIYLCALAIAGVAFSFAPAVSWVLVLLFFVEFTLAAGSSLLAKAGAIQGTLLPANALPRQPSRFQFHPLLQGAPIPNFDRHLPFPVHHNSVGLRGTESDPAILNKQIVVAALGGSSTYDIALAEGHTWPDNLNKELGSKYAVLNHGVPGYSTVEHLIQTLFYLDAYGIRPACAVYYVGWNDIHNAHLPHLDMGYADYHLPAQWTDFEIDKKPLIAQISPLARLLFPYVAEAVELHPVSMLPNYSAAKPVSGGDPRLEEIFRRNLASIAAINQQRGIGTIFVGQVLNRAKLKGNARYGWLPLVVDGDVWPLQARFNTILKETAEALKVPVSVPQIEDFGDADFIDQGHFSEAGASKFAKLIAPFVKANCNSGQ